MSVVSAREYRKSRTGAGNCLVLLFMIGLVGAVFWKRHEIVDYLGSFVKNQERAETAAARVTPLITPELAALGLKIGDPVFIRVFKESSQLELWMQPEGETEYVLYKTYPICKWSGDLGPKTQRGDGQTPEGFYWVAKRHLHPTSSFHLAFNIGYPNRYDKHFKRTGDHIMVHGDCVSVGCFAMTDEGIEEIYTLANAALNNDQKFFRVHSFPFRMTDSRMNQEYAAKSKHIEFWGNLKLGYDYFDITRQPPNVTVSGGKYVFEEN